MVNSTNIIKINIHISAPTIEPTHKSKIIFMALEKIQGVMVNIFIL